MEICGSVISRYNPIIYFTCVPAHIPDTGNEVDNGTPHLCLSPKLFGGISDWMGVL